MNNILILLPNYIGDVIMTTPAIRKISEDFSSANLVAVISENAYPAVKHNPRIKDFVLRPAGFSRMGLSGRIKFINSVKNKCLGGYDTAYVLRDTFFNRILSMLVSRRRFIVGASAEKSYKILALEAAGFLGSDISGIKEEAVKTEFYLSREDISIADEFIEMNSLLENFVVIHPRASRPAKNWSAEKFSQIVLRLFKDYGLKVVLTGSLEDVPYVEKIITLCSGGDKSGVENVAVNAAGVLSLGATAALISRAALVISSDTGIMHIAYTLGRKTLALFGSTHPVKYGPYPSHFHYIYKKLDCSPCYKKFCHRKPNSPLAPCMEAIEIEDVIAKIREFYR